MDKLGFNRSTANKVVMFLACFGSLAWMLNWKLAIFFMIALFIHELGHVWAMRRRGLKLKRLYFVPFVGAAAVPSGAFPSREAETFIAIMGPVWGFLSGVVMVGVYIFTGEPLYAAFAGWIGVLNLFNLLPVGPLDGGRILKSILFSISPKIGLVVIGFVVVALAFIMVKFGSIVILLMALFALMEFLRERRIVLRDLDRARIIEALAKFLKTRPEAEAVIAKISDMNDEILRLGGSHPFFFRTDVAYDDCSGMEDPTNWDSVQAYAHFKYACQDVAKAARSAGHGILFGHLNVVKDEEITLEDAFAGKGERSRLLSFLGEKELPRMRSLQILVALLAYVGIAFLLWQLIIMSFRVPGAMLSYVLFRQ